MMLMTPQLFSREQTSFYGYHDDYILVKVLQIDAHFHFCSCFLDPKIASGDGSISYLYLYYLVVTPTGAFGIVASNKPFL